MTLGHLAAELQLAADGSSYEIARIVEGDPWDADADSPLNAIGVEAKVGERIVAVNGQPVSRERPPQALLVHQANTKVELTLASAASGGQDAAAANGSSDAVEKRRRHHARRRDAGALSRMGRAQSSVGARRSRTDASATCTCPT